MKPDVITLWTIQPSFVWHALQEKGTLLVDSSHPDFLNNFQDLHESYDWLRKQMARRIPGYTGNYPWWAYEHFLDLRFYRWHHPSGSERMVRLGLEIPCEQVLLSGYESWHCVLNRSYLPRSVVWEEYEQEWDAWNDEASKYGVRTGSRGPSDQPFPEPWESQIQASWENIFDVDIRRPGETIQATFERLELVHVVHATEFTPAKYKTGRTR